ncbi:hypothetical protein L3X38_044065 [Prunus dulcis]|uniref:Uncharacterized protein n=1 Tax=Prunus dulcis TaxID=3755 RepID=A0AAD4YN37_PRUDU|nr:hypothetical protein L3X38_044065 [Prunus dulcis]
MNNVSLSVTTVEVLVVHAFDRVLHGLLVAEGDEAEAEAPGPPDLTVVDDLETQKETKSNQIRPSKPKLQSIIKQIQIINKNEKESIDLQSLGEKDQVT